MMQFEKALQALSDAGVEFVVIGGVSAIIHGSSYVTFDLDICYCRKPSNLHSLAAALRPFHPRLRGLPPDLPFVWDERTLCNGTIFTLDTDLGEIDLLAEVAGVGGYDEAVTGSITVTAYGRQVRTLDLPSLIRAKRAAGRVKDLQVLPELEALAEAQEPE
jgi:hypothetical protein